MQLQDHFEAIRKYIKEGQSRALQAAYTGLLEVYWQLGAYINLRLKKAEWGEKVVDQLANWLKQQERTLKGFDRRSLYRIKQFYLTWQGESWVPSHKSK